MIQIPQDMTEVKVKLAQLEELGHESTEAQVIFEAISDNAQAILDEKLEGHYYSCALDKDTLTVYDVIQKPIGKIKAQSHSFEEDFRQNAPQLLMYLDQQIQKIVNQR